MNTFTYSTTAEFQAARQRIDQIGVDFESQPDDLTIITDELSPREHDAMTDPLRAATDDAYDLNPANQAAAHDGAF